ncbi:cytidine deaminase-like protein [Trametes coccinea BRFM310]|uniref:Cytidine deaminase-like protein n=1 Tax=Trametes coccinea (strain BRFM310) TaxID=1353009 RepID=A0A1Y2IL06_TRAC3|nr:cytidine deaminase-like protein [Trametes coccinea BRFM310]
MHIHMQTNAVGGDPQSHTMAYHAYYALIAILLVQHVLGHKHVSHSGPLQNVVALPTLAINNVPAAVRQHWIRRANAAVAELVSPCPVSAFGSVIVNHTASTSGELVCIGVNSKENGDPILHGEISAIQNCSAILTDPAGAFKLNTTEAQAAFAGLSLYTNAESCPMCASAIRFAGFREYIYGTSIETLVELGFVQIRVPSIEIFRQSFDLPHPARLLGGVLTNETDPLFSWQFNPDFPCPAGCARGNGSTMCLPI